VTVYPDNSIRINYAGTEMGQGSMTHTPMILAEHLDADWDKVTVETLAVHDEAYGNPVFKNILYTAGSTNVMVYFDRMRMAGEQARRMLMQAAAAHWAVPLAELSTEPSVVVHRPSGRKLAYGEIVALGNLSQEVPEITEAEFKPKSAYRYVGKSLPRIDVPSKVNGTAEFGMDVQVPGMVHAAMVRAPVEDESPLEVDDAEARQVKGVTDVVILPHAVAVVADTIEAARWGKQKLKVKWSEESPFRKVNSDTSLDEYSKRAADLTITGPVWSESGDVKAGLATAVEVVDALYTSEPAYHAQMEPLNATAAVSADGKSAEIWVGTQSQSLTIIGSAETLETTNDKITLHPLTMGGGYGRRSTLHQQYVDDALMVSRELKRPVKVIWTREDDLESGLFRPSASQYLRAGFDAEGKLIALHHRVAAPEHLPTMNRLRWEWAKPKDVISMLGSENSTYDIPNHQAEHIVCDRGSRVCAWRGVATSYTKFAMESLIDELALARAADPVEFRLQLCQKNPRMISLLNTLAEMSDWSRPRDNGHALGIAISGYARSLSAGAVEISVDEKTGKIHVHKVWGVGDAGYIVSPDNAVAQLEGNIIFGLSAALKERITVRDGVVQQTNFHQYPILRMSEVPEIEARVMSNDNPSTGVGELGLAMVAPALANAVARLTGKRIRHMPLTPDVVAAALKV
jgi:isoquinoline 1-oxidoreductase beta subunit